MLYTLFHPYIPIGRNTLYTFTVFIVFEDKKYGERNHKDMACGTAFMYHGYPKVYGLDQPSHVVIEGRPDGILIKRLHLNGDEESYGSNTT
jgi:hypothetical protein